jgi:GntR family transcriptional regulator
MTKIHKVDKKSLVPVYQQIAHDILARISAEEWGVGDKLPSESEFCEEYESSRVTIRQALTKLELEGYIDKMRGKGTFIKASPSLVVQDLVIPQIGVSRKTDIFSANIVMKESSGASPVVQNNLRIGAEEKVVHLTRHFLKDGRTIGISKVWFPSSKVPGIAQNPLENNSITDTLQNRYKVRFSSIENFIESISIDAETAHLLNTVSQSPGLKICTVYFDESGIPIEYAETIWNGSDTKFHLNLSSKN